MMNPRRPKKRVAGLSPVNPANPTARFEEVTSVSLTADASLGTPSATAKYWRFIPSDGAMDAKGWTNLPYPTIGFIPGSEERGNDNLLQMTGGQNLAQKLGFGTNNNGTPDANFPYLVYFIQLPDSGDPQWSSGVVNLAPFVFADQILAHTEAAYVCNTNRRFLTGLSYGGTRPWDIAYRHPTRYAGLIPCAGIPAYQYLGMLPGVTVSPATYDRAAEMCAVTLAGLPMRPYWSSEDENVGPLLWNPTVTAFNAAGAGWVAGTHYIDTEGDHASTWNTAYTDMINGASALRVWLDAQTR